MSGRIGRPHIFGTPSSGTRRPARRLAPETATAPRQGNADGRPEVRLLSTQADFDAWMQDANNRAYINSEKFQERWQDLMARFDDGEFMRAGEAANLLQIPFRVFVHALGVNWQVAKLLGAVEGSEAIH
jgi:hypothetical protein